MELVRIEKINLVDAVYTQLRDFLVSDQWPEGTKIPSENELCKQFSVSRVVVREALQKLRGEKLIVTRQGVGTYVANPSNFIASKQTIELSEQVYREFLDFRQAVEFNAIKLAKNQATKEDFRKMAACVDTMEAAGEDDNSYNIADYSFHLSVVEASHNDWLVRAMVANQNAILNVFSAMNAVPGCRDFGVKSHRQIIENLRNGQIRVILESYREMGQYNMTRLQRFFDNEG